MNRGHSVVFEIVSKYCISDPFVDHDGYSISSKGFLPTASSAYLRLLIILLAILIPVYESSSPAFHMLLSAYKLKKWGDDI